VSAKDSAPLRRGRPPIEAAESHARILDAVYELLRDRSIRDLTMEAVAKRAGVGKPTLYKWWPTKASLVLAMFKERIAVALPPPSVGTAEEAIRDAARALIGPLNGQLGKVLSELIAEGQSEPAILRELFDKHIRGHQEADAAGIERGKTSGELASDVDPQLIIDAVFGAIFYRLLFRTSPLTEEFSDKLVRQVFRGARARSGEAPTRSKARRGNPAAKARHENS
jgi:AcrR family transcriptional regulator